MTMNWPNKKLCFKYEIIWYNRIQRIRYKMDYNSRLLYLYFGYGLLCGAGICFPTFKSGDFDRLLVRQRMEQCLIASSRH